LYWDARRKKSDGLVGVISPAAPEGTIFYRGAEKRTCESLEDGSKSEGSKAGQVHREVFSKTVAFRL